MPALGYHSNTSMAVKAVIKEIKRRLSSRFDLLEGFPDFFYDFEKGLSPQFKQYYAKIATSKRQKPWIILAYSYDSANKSNVQPRNGFRFYRPVTSILKREIDCNFANLPIVFSILTNDSKLLNGLTNYISIHFDWSFSTEFQDLLWPTWVANVTYPLGWYIRPSKPNGYLYMCSKAGLSGNIEPDWQATIANKQLDNEIEWACIEADKLTVKAGSFVKNDTVIQNPIENGIMYQYDFGYTLHYADFDDAGSLTGIVTKASVDLLNYYKEHYFKETIKVNTSIKE